MKKVLLSYDYELFFGERSGTVQNTLIEPTSIILNAMDAAGLKGTFFVDWLMLKYLALENDERAHQDYDRIVNQLKDIVCRGHRIELHVHPHWVDARYNGDGTWNFEDFTHYSLQSFTEEEVTRMFVDGTDLLTGIAREVDPDYKIVAFRAGGWAIQPFDKVKKGFLEAGIKVDSSVAYGVFAYNKYSFYDFRNAPKADLYRFDDDVCVPSKNGQFIEVPIASYHRAFINKIFDKPTNMFSDKLQFLADGTHYREEDARYVKEHPLGEKTYLGMLGFRTNPINMIINLYRQPRNLVCYIDHPKDITGMTATNIKTLGKVASTVLYSDLVDKEQLI